jgi:GNAT superfamily N-acetyltransferase
MRLIELTPDRAEEVFQIGAEMHRLGVYKDWPLDRGRSLFVIKALITDPKAMAIGVETKDGVLIGAMLGEVQQDLWVNVRVAIEYGVYVIEAYRGTSAGIRMIQHFEKWAAQHGADVIRQGVYAGIDNEKTGAIFSRLGYENAGAIYKKVI